MATHVRDPLLDPTDLDGQEAGDANASATPTRRRRRALGVLFWLATGWLGIVAICALAGPWLPVADPLVPDVPNKLASPSFDHPLGTDGLGRDQFSRAVHGARVSLAVSLTAVSIGMVIGGTIGTLVGYVRGLTETVVMAINDVVLAFPGLIVLLVLVAYMGRGLLLISIAIGCLSIPVYTRVARANTLAVAQREFVHAAATLGAKRSRILFREIIPNVMMSVAAFGLVAMGVVIVLEGALAFLNLSIEPPDPTWGGMIAEGRRHMKDAPLVALMPALVMFFTVLSLNFVGDTLRRRVDVKDVSL